MEVMKRNTPKASMTAAIMAFHRATEMLRQEEDRVCQDPWAGLFLPEEYRAILKNPQELYVLATESAKRFPGINGAVVARTRFIDDIVLEYVKKGLEQLVILGAGYDSRAYRMEGIKEQTMVFELDQPSTQAIKIQKITDILNIKPAHVTYVPIDLFHDDMKACLRANGYDPSKRSLFILEGLTFYLSADVFDRILASIAQDASSRTGVVFDYLPPSVIDGTSDRAEVKNSRTDLQEYGEPYRLGLRHDELESLLAQRGFDLVENLNARDCKEKYFFGQSRNREITPIFYFAHAVASRPHLAR